MPFIEYYTSLLLSEIWCWAIEMLGCHAFFHFESKAQLEIIIIQRLWLLRKRLNSQLAMQEQLRWKSCLCPSAVHHFWELLDAPNSLEKCMLIWPIEFLFFMFSFSAFDRCKSMNAWNPWRLGKATTSWTFCCSWTKKCVGSNEA